MPTNSLMETRDWGAAKEVFSGLVDNVLDVDFETLKENFLSGWDDMAHRKPLQDEKSMARKFGELCDDIVGNLDSLPGKSDEQKARVYGRDLGRFLSFFHRQLLREKEGEDASWMNSLVDDDIGIDASETLIRKCGDVADKFDKSGVGLMRVGKRMLQMERQEGKNLSGAANDVFRRMASSFSGEGFLEKLFG